MLFKDHPGYAPDNEFWKKMGPPVCPSCLKDLLPHDEIHDDGHVIGHLKCSQQGTCTGNMKPEDFLVDPMSLWEPAFVTAASIPKWSDQYKPISPYLEDKNQYRLDDGSDRIEVPIYTINEKGERVQTGSITISKKEFHKDNPEFKPSDVPNTLKEWVEN